MVVGVIMIHSIGIVMGGIAAIVGVAMQQMGYA